MTVSLSLGITLFMIVGSSKRLTKVMELTKMPWDYKLFLAGLGLLFLAAAWIFEKHAAMPLSKFFGRLKMTVTGRQKQRKRYKEIQDDLRTEMM